MCSDLSDKKNNHKNEQISSDSLQKSVENATDAVSIKKELEEAKKKAEEYLNSWKRSQADFINYKRRQSELFGELIGSANLELILEILPIYEALSLAASQVPENLKDLGWTKGVIQIKIQLENLLKKKGLEEIKSLGEKFNPEIHEAVEMISSSDKSEGEILEEMQKGYKLNGKVIRAAKVKLAKLVQSSK